MFLFIRIADLDYDEEEGTSSVQQGKKIGKAEQKEIQFMNILAKVGSVLLSKSLTPAMKAKKKKAAQAMSAMLLVETGEEMTPEQVTKKVCFSSTFSHGLFKNVYIFHINLQVANAKQRIKSKVDMKKTGNMPIILKRSETILLECLQSQDNPAITEIKSMIHLFVSSFLFTLIFVPFL